MGCEVYANGNAIACKAADGKTTAAMPDVCLSPPSPPAGPVPIPYPNTGMASDTTDGSKTVQISGQEVMLKDKSVFKQSSGDEAATKSFGMGVVTHQIQGKVNFIAWSMDVKFEGENVPRHLDLTGHNEASDPPNTPPWPYMDAMARDGTDPCEEEKDKEKAACKNSTPPDDCSPACSTAQKCKLVPKGKDKEQCCSPSKTGHHLIEDHWVKGLSAFPTAQNSSGYNAAPTVCVEGGRYEKEHGEMHMVQGLIEEAHMPGGRMASIPWNYGEGKFAAITAHDAAFGDSGCSKPCMEAQLDSFYGSDESRPLNPPTTQGLAQNDPGDGRWLRSEGAEAIAPLLSGG
jgi:hypothetical protein